MKHDLKLLEDLIRTPGPSACEAQIQEKFLAVTADIADKQYADPVGNCYSEIKGDTEKRVVFTAHCDTIGSMVRYIDDQGFIFTEDIGGNEEPGVADARTLPGSKVSILSRHNKDLVAGQIIPVVPYHLVKDEFDVDMNETRYEMAVDIGATDFEDAQMQVDVGDYVIFRASFEKLGERISATYLDNRLSLYALVQLGIWFKKARIKNKPTLVLCSTVCEESALNVAGQVTRTGKPDVCVTLDVAPATDSIVHDADFEVFKKHGKCTLTGGPVIGRGLGVTDEVFLALEETAVTKNIDHQIELAKAETDNIAIHTAGAKTGLIMIPVRNAHTPIEMFDLKDLEATLKLCKAYISG